MNEEELDRLEEAEKRLAEVKRLLDEHIAEAKEPESEEVD